MEMVLCKKYTGRIELPVAAQYYDDSNVCRSCFSFDLCKEEREEEEISQYRKESNNGKC